MTGGHGASLKLYSEVNHAFSVAAFWLAAAVYGYAPCKL